MENVVFDCELSEDSNVATLSRDGKPLGNINSDNASQFCMAEAGGKPFSVNYHVKSEFTPPPLPYFK